MRITTMIVSLTLILTLGVVRAGAGEKLAVLDFKSILVPPEMGEAVAEILRTELTGIGGYTIVERGMLKEVLREQALQNTGIVAPETAVNIGKILDARLVILGSIIKTGKIYTINSRFIEVETGVIRKGKNITGEGDEKIPEMVHQLALDIKESTQKVEPFILSFEDPTRDLGGWYSAYDDEPATFECVKQYATDGGRSLKVGLPRREAPDNYPGIFNNTFPIDWSGFRRFTADVHFEAEKGRSEHFAIRIDDKDSTDFKDRFHFGLVIVPGLNRIDIDLEKVKTILDIRTIRLVFFFFDEPKADVTLYLDNIRLQ
jgi:hypothetical protein